MAFLDSPRFPTDINYGVIGGPTYKTNIIEKNSGWENANVVWPQGWLDTANLALRLAGVFNEA